METAGDPVIERYMPTKSPPGRQAEPNSRSSDEAEDSVLASNQCSTSFGLHSRLVRDFVLSPR